MKLHIDCLEEKLAELDHYKEENSNLREKIKDVFMLKSENLSLVKQLRQAEETLQKMKNRLIELEEKSKSLTLPVSVNLSLTHI